MNYSNSNGLYQTTDQAQIHFLLSQEMLTQAFCGGMSCGLVEGKKGLQFVAVVWHLNEYQMYWLKFDSEYIEFQTLARFLAEFYNVREWEKKFMDTAARWKMRSTHPDWPCEMDEGAWSIFEMGLKLKS